MRAFVITASALAVILLGAFVVCYGTGCANMKDPVCKAIAQGIARIDKELEGGADDGDVLEVYRQSIDPVVQAKGLDSVLDQAKEYWDSLSTAEKLAMGRAVLVFMQQQYCEGSGGCVGTPSKDKVKATIAGIIRAYAAPVIQGQRRPYEAGK